MRKILISISILYLSMLLVLCDRIKSPVGSDKSGPDVIVVDDTVSVPEEPVPEPVTGLNRAYLPLEIGNEWTFDYLKEIKSGASGEAWYISGEMVWTVIDSALIDTLEYYTVDVQIAGISIYYFFDNSSIDPDTNYNYTDSKQFKIVKYDTVIYEMQYKTSWNLLINNDVLKHFSQVTTDTLLIKGSDYYPWYEITNIGFIKDCGIHYLEWQQASNTFVKEELTLKDMQLEE